MSYTELYKINKNGDVSLYKEFKNSHLGAMFLWTKIFDKYRNTYFPDEKYLHVLLGGNNQYDFWNLFEKEEFPELLSILLLNSYDHVMVKKEEFKILTESFREFDKLFIEENTNSHYLDYIKAIEKLLKDEECIGLCWNQTSVNSNPWNVYIEEDEETGEILEDENIIDRNYNIFKDNYLGQYFLDLKSQKEVK